MKLSEKSWHHKIYSFLRWCMPIFTQDDDMFPENPESLCRYFWSFVLAPMGISGHWLICMPFAIFIVILGSPFFLWMFLRDKNQTFLKKTDFISNAFKSTKSKFCPVIDWAD